MERLPPHSVGGPSQSNCTDILDNHCCELALWPAAALASETNERDGQRDAESVSTRAIAEGYPQPMRQLDHTRQAAHFCVFGAQWHGGVVHVNARRAKHVCA